MASVGNYLGSVQLVVRDPRAHGVLSRRGASFDCHFHDPEQWVTWGADILPTVGAACMTHYPHQHADMSPTDWDFSHWATDWVQCRPAPEEKYWLEQPSDGSGSSYPHVIARSRVPFGTAEGAVSIWLRNSEPMTTGWDVGSDAEPDLLSGNYPHTFVQFCSQPIPSSEDSTERWMILFPEGTAQKRPLLMRYARWRVTTPLTEGEIAEAAVVRDVADGSVDVARSPRIPSQHASDWDWFIERELDAQTHGVDKTFSVRPLGNGWVLFDWERGQGPRAELYLPGWPVGRCYMAVGGRAVSWAWHVGKPQYTLSSDATLRHRTPFTVPPDVTAARTETYSADVPTGTTVTVDTEDSGTQRFPLVTLETTNADITPVVYRATLTHQPTWGSAVTTAVFDSSSDGHRILRAEWTAGSTWRGARLTAEVLDRDADTEFRPNQVVELKAKLDADAAYTESWTGRVARATSVPQIVGRVWRLECADEAMRLSHVRRGSMLGSLAGMTFHGAVQWALNCAGVTDTRIVLWCRAEWRNVNTLNASDTRLLPWTSDNIGQLTFSLSSNVPQILDRLCDMVGWKWGINSGPGSHATGSMGWGDVCLWPSPGNAARTLADAGAIFAWSSANATSAQHVIERDTEGTYDYNDFGNTAIVAGKTDQRMPAMGYAAMRASVTDPTDGYFIGDWWDLCESRSDCSPGLLAADLLADAHTGAHVVSWGGPPVLSIRPGVIVKVQVGGTDASPVWTLAELTNVRMSARSRRLSATYTAEVVRYAAS